MVGIIGGMFGGFARPMTSRATPVPPVAAPSDSPAASQRSNLPVAIVPARPASPVPIPHDLFLNQFTTPSTAAVASIAFAAPHAPEQSLTELKAHNTYLAVAAEGN